MLVRQLGLSLGTILFRARDLNLMSEQSYVNAVKYMSRRGCASKSPDRRSRLKSPRS